MKKVDIAILGGGISGTALLYVLSKYSNIKSIALFEKYPILAPLNSNANNNSQTLHCGDMETNYSYEKACLVKKQANMIVKYAHMVSNDFIFKCPKMILGVGEEEIEYIKNRHEEFAPAFKYMKLYDYKNIAKYEPNVAKIANGMRTNIIASGAQDEYSAVNYATLANSFAKEAQKLGKDLEINLETKVKNLIEKEDHVVLHTAKGEYSCKYLVVSAGASSLLFAHNLGYGLNLSILPMAGSFYFTPKALNGKVYTLQNEKLPFAAVHGDYDLSFNDKTRFGPTALFLPKLERYKPGTYLDFWRSFKLNGAVIKVLYDLMRDKVIRNYILKNILYEVPLLNRYLFLSEIQKVVPTTKFSDVKFAKGIGGVRPQIINKTTKELSLGEASINPNNKPIIFNITPSPGATTSLANAYKDAEDICAYLNIKFYKEQLEKDLL